MLAARTMSDTTLKDLAMSLQNSLEHIATMGLHQHILLNILGQEVQTAEQEALVFALDCCQAAEHDWRVKADEKLSQLLKLVESPIA